VADPIPGFDIDHDRIRLDEAVFVYLERTFAVAEPVPPGEVPRPYGLAAPAVLSAEAVLVAVPRGEAIWLGFEAVEPNDPAILRVRINGPDPLDAVTGEPWDEELVETPRNHLVCPPEYCLPGVRGESGFMPFGQADGPPREVLEELTVIAHRRVTAQVAIRLVTDDLFARATGIAPEPIDPDSSYKGWRLP
jgi:hypothetical protein